MSDSYRFSGMDDARHRSEDSASEDHLRDIEINPFELLRLLVRKGKTIAWTVGLAAIAAAVVMIFTPNMYTSRATILPSGGSDNLTGIMGLAGSLGLAGGGGSVDENSSVLYPSILKSNLVRDGVLSKTYAFDHAGENRTVNLKQYFNAVDPNELRTKLSKITSIGTDKKLGIVSISVETEYAGLSQAVLHEYLAQLESYLMYKRRTQAGENETYLTSQLADRTALLRSAEESLRKFMEANRNWSVSTDPELQMEMARLKRDVEIQSETYLLLTQQLEMARLESRKDIPIVRILDQPSLPTFKSSPARTLTVIFAAMAAFLALAGWIVVAYIWRQMGHGEANYKALREDISHSFPRSRRILNIVSRSSKRQSVTVDD